MTGSDRCFLPGCLIEIAIRQVWVIDTIVIIICLKQKLRKYNNQCTKVVQSASIPRKYR